jgi:hypothetical protein
MPPIIPPVLLELRQRKLQKLARDAKRAAARKRQAKKKKASADAKKPSGQQPQAQAPAQTQGGAKAEAGRTARSKKRREDRHKKRAENKVEIYAHTPRPSSAVFCSLSAVSLSRFISCCVTLN